MGDSLFRLLGRLHNCSRVQTGSTDGTPGGVRGPHRLAAGSGGSLPPSPAVRGLRRARRVQALGSGLVRLGLAFILALFGTLKFFRFEAVAIQPVISHSPLLAWMYLLFNVRTVAAVLGSVELLAALGLLLGPRWPRLGAMGGALASVRFLTTLSFLFTTPGLLVAGSDTTGLLLKDLVLLGVSLQAMAGFHLAARGRPVAVPEPAGLRALP